MELSTGKARGFDDPFSVSSFGCLGGELLGESRNLVSAVLCCFLRCLFDGDSHKSYGVGSLRSDEFGVVLQRCLDHLYHLENATCRAFTWRIFSHRDKVDRRRNGIYEGQSYP